MINGKPVLIVPRGLMAAMRELYGDAVVIVESKPVPK